MTTSRMLGISTRDWFKDSDTPRWSSKRHVLAEYVTHYNHSQPHQAVDLSPPRPPATVIDLNEQRRIRRKPILSRLINEYEHAA
jgi:putative transposase